MGWDKLHPQECVSSGQAGPCAIYQTEGRAGTREEEA